MQGFESTEQVAEIDVFGPVVGFKVPRIAKRYSAKVQSTPTPRYGVCQVCRWGCPRCRQG
jgi:hypothetical protein